ncbi:hypothetical protein RF11_15493 [Thelohanellus kitauei]|uniref:ISXO2-like transposase domain-containing protein n=1 Tax=Thelohanellus kitauei TaxID=669202 RepID=A0A0C2IJ38_THEKT|nr:hypothetical protein RF11_15493 [Thelohanellus kitauei]
MVSTFFEILAILQDEEKAILYLLEKNIVPALNTCPANNGTGIKRRGRNWRCSSKYCRKEYHIFKNTLFSISKLQINEVLSLCYFWLTESKHKQLCLITGHSPSTITSIMRYLRKMAGKIDESKLGKNKYNRGHLVSGPWVLGGVEKTREIKAFQVEVPDRTAETLINIIRRYVLPGSRLSSYYEHLTANHSQSFINRANGACTNTIEGTWSALKMKISPRNRKNSFNEDGELEENTSDQFLGEFLWRRKNSGNLWEGLLKCIRESLCVLSTFDQETSSKSVRVNLRPSALNNDMHLRAVSRKALVLYQERRQQNFLIYTPYEINEGFLFYYNRYGPLLKIILILFS